MRPPYRHLLCALMLLALLPGSGAAQDNDDQNPLDLFGEHLRDLMEQIEPALDDAWDLLRSLQMIDDPRHYEAPVVLPNGDIILRRRDDAPDYSPPADAEDPAGPGVRT